MKHTVTVNIAGASFTVQTDADAVTINDVKFVFTPTLPVETKKAVKLLCKFTYTGPGDILARVEAVQRASNIGPRAWDIVKNNAPFEVDEENVEAFEQFCANNKIMISYLPTT